MPRCARPSTDGYRCSIGLSLSDIPKRVKEQSRPRRVIPAMERGEDDGTRSSVWLLGVPIPVIILLWLFFGR